MNRIKLTVGDTRPPVYAHLTDPAGPIDVSSAAVTVQMKFFRKGDASTVQIIPGTKLAGTMQRDGLTEDMSQYPIPGSGGRVRFDFPLGSLDVPPGLYEGEIEVVSGAGLLTPQNTLEFYVKEDEA